MDRDNHTTLGQRIKTICLHMAYDAAITMPTQRYPNVDEKLSILAERAAVAVLAEVEADQSIPASPPCSFVEARGCLSPRPEGEETPEAQIRRLRGG